MSRFSFSILFILFAQFSFAQSQNIKDLYFDFLQIRTELYKTDQAISVGLALLNRPSELNNKQIASITYHLGRMYEADDDMAKAIPYYERIIELTPGYYVPYRALGFWYFKTIIDLEQKLKRMDEVKEAELYAKINAEYQKLVVKTIPYLEKSQACDPDEETLSMIVDLYKSLKDVVELNKLNARLKSLANNCITLLDDE